MRVEFINETGGKMFVDESRVNEYKEAGYILASDVLDGDTEFIEEKEQPVPKKRGKKRV